MTKQNMDYSAMSVVVDAPEGLLAMIVLGNTSGRVDRAERILFWKGNWRCSCPH